MTTAAGNISVARWPPTSHQPGAGIAAAEMQRTCTTRVGHRSSQHKCAHARQQMASAMRQRIGSQYPAAIAADVNGATLRRHCRHHARARAAAGSASS